jgi:hypothetical protein
VFASPALSSTEFKAWNIVVATERQPKKEPSDETHFLYRLSPHVVVVP